MTRAALLLFAPAVALTLWGADPGPADKAGWPLFRGNAAQTGVAAGKLPDRLEEVWKFTAEDSFDGAVAVADGVIFAASLDEHLYAVGLKDGKQKWKYKAAPFKAPVSVRKGLVYVGDLDGALAAYETAHRETPGNPAIANNLAWALLQHAARWPEAEPLILTALAAGPEPRGFYLDTLGLLRMRQGAYGDALGAFRRALEDAALDLSVRARVLGHAALALEGLGDRERAERCRTLARGLQDERGGRVC